MTLRSRLMIGLIATASFPLISFGADTTSAASAPRVYSDTEIAYIRGLNCDILTTDAKGRCLDIKKAALSQPNTATGNTLPPPVRTESGSDDRHPPMPPVSDSDTLAQKPPKPPMGTGDTNDRLLLPAVQKRGGDESSRIVGGGPGGGPHVRMMKDGTGTMMGTGTDMEDPMHNLSMAIGRLTPTDRDTLIKMIREYLTSKGLTLGAPEVKKDETERKGWDGSIKGKKTDTEIQTERSALLAKAKEKREAMRKEYVGHVTLMK